MGPVDDEAPERRRLTRQEKKAQTRRQLIDAAERVFDRDGFFGASIDAVAEEAGFSKGAVYSNFESKEDLLVALMKERVEEQAGVIAASVDRTAPVGNQARSAGEQFARTYWADEPGTFELEFRVCAARNPELRDHIAPQYRAIRDAIAGMIEEGAAERGVRLSIAPEHLATAIGALTIGLRSEQMLDPESVPPELFGELLAILFEASESSGPQ